MESWNMKSCGKALAVPLDSLIERLRLDAVEFSKMHI